MVKNNMLNRIEHDSINADGINHKNSLNSIFTLS
jgi:hypothetical protein